MSELPEETLDSADPECAVPADYVSKWNTLYGYFQKSLRPSMLRELECVTLQLMHALDTDQVQIDNDESGRFLKLMISKISQELWGLIGSLRYAAYYACFHHSRSILELYAGLAYVYNDPDRTGDRLQKFFEFEDVYKFNFYNSLREKLEEGAIDQSHFDSMSPLTEEKYAALAARTDDWIRMYRPRNGDISKIKHWHQSATILTLFENTDSFETLWEIYEFLSHATHFSPFGYHLTGGFFLFGYPIQDGNISIEAINRPIKAALLSLHHIDLLFQNKLDLGFGLEFESSPAEWV